MAWKDAVAKWRAGGGKGKIPKKGTPEYEQILKTANEPFVQEKPIRLSKGEKASMKAIKNAILPDIDDIEDKDLIDFAKLALAKYYEIPRIEAQRKRTAVKRHGGKKDEAFIKDMEAKFFTKIDATVGPKGGVSKTPAKVKKAQEISEEAAQAGFTPMKVRKVRSDKGSKRTKKE
jgi:hypothetical protein